MGAMGWFPPGWVELALVGALVAPPLLAIIVVSVRAARQQPEVFAARHGLALTERSRPMVARYLSRSWRFRIGGALLGAILPFGSGILGVELLGGYLIGSLIGELTHTRLHPGGRRAASITPRVLADYLPSRSLWAVRGMALASVASVLLVTGLPRRGPDVGLIPIAVMAVGATAVAILVEVLLRLIVARSQPAVEIDLIAADDAIRAASAHATAGAGIGVLLLLFSSQLWRIGALSDWQVLRWAAAPLSLTAFAAAFVVWSVLGHDRPWRVRKLEPETART